MKEEKFIILLKQARGSLFVFDDFVQLGYKVIYIDTENVRPDAVSIFIQYDLNNDLKMFFDEFDIQLSALNIIGVMAFSEHLKIAEMQIAEHFGLLRIPRDTYFYGRDKVLMKEKIKTASIPFINYKFINQEDTNIQIPMPFPFIVKPNLGYASGGVYLVSNEDEFKKAVKSVKRLNFFVLQKGQEMKAGILCEEYINGPEFSVDSIHVDGKLRTICICQRGFPSETNFSDYIYLTPPAIYPFEIHLFQEIVEKISNEIGYSWGPSHAEFRIDQKTGKIYLLEIGLRVGFTGNIGRLCKLTTGFNYNLMAIRAHLGELTYSDLSSFNITSTQVGLSFIPNTGTGGEILEIQGLDFIKNEKKIINYYFNKGPGEIVIPWPKGLEYLGEITAVTESQLEMKNLIDEITREVVFKYK